MTCPRYLRSFETFSYEDTVHYLASPLITSYLLPVIGTVSFIKSVFSWLLAKVQNRRSFFPFPFPPFRCSAPTSNATETTPHSPRFSQRSFSSRTRMSQTNPRVLGPSYVIQLPVLASRMKHMRQRPSYSFRESNWMRFDTLLTYCLRLSSSNHTDIGGKGFTATL